ncbi:MAG: OmpA family protein [Deltaproteobacteria bacterium]|nr:OmpA family protein [Deltaproteobacteria bacterium]
MRARSLIIALGVLATLSTVAALSAAQPRPREPIDVERFKPAVTHDGFVTAEGSGVRPTADPWEFGLFANYAYNPLVVVNQDGEIVDQFVSGRLGFDVLASVTLWEPFAIGLDLPFFIAQTGDEDPSFGGLGDLRIVPKFRILDDRELFGLGVIAELRVPTHVGDFSGGARNVVFVPRLVADHRFGSTGFRLGANAGAALREKTEFENVNALSEFVYAGAASYRIGGWDGMVAIGAEVNGGVGLTSVDLEELPLEGILFAKINPTNEWEISFGPAMGIVPGYGIPTFRAFAGVRYTPTNNDRDGDGIPDDEDKCPDTPEDRDGVEDADGCPEHDEVGDDDQDGIPNLDDQCPDQKETINGIQDEDGCPDGGPAKVIRKDNKLLILENVEFATGSAIIRTKSYSILNQIALVLKANPDIKKLRVEGHTDSRGPREMNIVLSKARANSVRVFLIRGGIDSRRLESEGYGPDRPLVKEVDEPSLQKNRRVEFVVVDKD